MKYADVEKMHEAGLITVEQQTRIVEHFKLKEEDGRFLTVISIVGGVLLASGLALLIAANWEQIPRGVKIAAGLLLMLGAHAFGWYLRQTKGYPKSGEALHLGGSCLFLANIALIGQIYNISTRPPNAFLLWWLGIAALPWLLQSKPQFILTLLAFSVWFGMEINQEGSPIYFGNDESQLLLYASLGLVFLGGGYCLRRTAFSDFAAAAEKFGLLGFMIFVYPLTWSEFYRDRNLSSQVCPWIFPGLACLAAMLAVRGMGGLTNLPRQWKWTWALALLGMLGLLAGEMYFVPERSYGYQRGEAGYHWLAAVALFIFCLLQTRTGLHDRSAFMVNLAVVFIALDIIVVYINLFGSMTRTGLVFVGGGIFLLLFGIYLEKQRRALIRQLKAPM